MRVGRLNLKRGLFRVTVIWAIVCAGGAVAYTGYRCGADHSRFEDCKNAFLLVLAGEPPAGADYWCTYDDVVKQADAFILDYMNTQVARWSEPPSRQRELFLHAFRPCLDKAFAVRRAQGMHLCTPKT